MLIRSLAVAAVFGSGAFAWGQVVDEDQVRAVVSEMLADAESRSSLLEGGASSGYDKGFFVASEDGNFKLLINGMLQFRYFSNLRDDDAGLPGRQDDWTHGFQKSRTRVSFGGNLGDKTLKYYFLTGAGSNGQWGILDAYVRKDISKEWFVQAGQFKLPLMYEWLMTERTQQFVERSLVEAQFSQQYSEGVMVGAQFDDWRFFAAFSDGLRTRDTDFVDASGNQLTADWAATGRVELKLIGEWADYTDFESFRNGKPELVIGAAIHGQDGRDVASASDRSIVRWTADVSWKLGGANIDAAVVGSREEATGATYDQWGVVVQGGVFVSDPLELIARYEWGDLDGEGAIEQNLSVVTAGFNYFFSKHAMKLTVDGGYSFETMDSKWTGGTARGWLGDAPGADGQFVVRAQFQVLF